MFSESLILALDCYSRLIKEHKQLERFTFHCWKALKTKWRIYLYSTKIIFATVHHTKAISLHVSKLFGRNIATLLSHFVLMCMLTDPFIPPLKWQLRMGS